MAGVALKQDRMRARQGTVRRGCLLLASGVISSTFRIHMAVYPNCVDRHASIESGMTLGMMLGMTLRYDVRYDVGNIFGRSDLVAHAGV